MALKSITRLTKKSKGIVSIFKKTYMDLAAVNQEIAAEVEFQKMLIEEAEGNKKTLETLAEANDKVMGKLDEFMN